MLTGAVSRRYAQALLEIGTQTNSLDQLENELGRFVVLLDDNRELQQHLYHPSIVVEAKKELVDAILTKDGYSQVARSFILLVIERRRENYLKDIYREFVRLANQARNLLEAQVTSAIELSQEQVKKLTKEIARLTGKTIILKQKVDPALIGGIVITIGDRVIDGSVVGKLQGMREALLKAPLTV
ncbi:F0F1 ATP synthase subunit delta [Heliorestis acidaminivorans]|uniref:ATP synthase subunit delta n=1 Tax=Heliorestis acidaminivorans TaxID=553427 RepID=A0A6I0F550_9FIRM|nr:F0F1 ATP synthase subunit delta [Heliorestis acidaminivorans]KAB2953807.1 F0F1 ATP synthase subunit delta [Heliorestis acidaminivorans]